MGLGLSRSLAAFSARNDRRVLLLGLDGAGKSALLAAAVAAGGGGRAAPPPPSPLRGVALASLRVGRLTFKVWDVSGGEPFRPHWRHSYVGAQGVVFVVDAADAARVPLAAAELAAAADDAQLADAAFLVLANKSDAPGALPVDALARALGLPAALARARAWAVLPASAARGEGVDAALAFLAANMRAL